MINPFKELFTPKLNDPEGEEFGGSFGCQERGCYSVVTTAKYIRELELLSWICKEGHVNKIEGYTIND